MGSKTSSAVACLLLTNVIWAGNALIARHAGSGDMQPLSMNYLRWLIGAVVLLPFCGREIWQQRHVWGQRAVLWRMAVLASCGMVVYNSLLYAAAHHTTAINIALLNTCIPLATFITSGLILKQWPKPASWLGLLIAATGLLYLISAGQWQVLVSLSFNRGDLMMLIGVLAWAVYLVLFMPWGSRMGLSAMSMLNLLMWTAVCIMTPLFVLEVSREGLPAMNQGNVLTFAYIGVLVSVVSYLAWNYGIAHIGAAKASLSLYTMPVFAAILSYVILGEGLKAYHWIGGAIIVMGLVLASVLGKARAAST